MFLPDPTRMIRGGTTGMLIRYLTKMMAAVTGQGSIRHIEKASRGQGGSPRLIAMKPLEAPSNRFPALLVQSMSPMANFTFVPFEWSKLGQGTYDVVVFHWPTEFFRPTSRRQTLTFLHRALWDRLRHGTRFVWIVHNLQPHDGGSLQSPLTTRLFLRLLGGLIFLSRSSREQLHAMYPVTRRIKSLLTAHGVYPDVLGPPLPYGRNSAACRLLFFGTVRAYKNPVGLVQAARRVSGASFSLHLAGQIWQDDNLRDEIAAAAGDDPRITLDLRSEHIPEAELERLIDSHDAVVLPYDKVLNSGVAFHALSRNKPILAPRTASLPELCEAVGSEWVHLFESPLDSSHLKAFIVSLADTTASAPDLSPFAWDKIGRDTTDFLRSL